MSNTFSTKKMFCWKSCGFLDCFLGTNVLLEKLWIFGLFSGDKDDYIDRWMMKITIKTNQIDMNVCFFEKYITYKNNVCRKSPAFSPLFYWFVNLTLTDKHGTKHLQGQFPPLVKISLFHYSV